MHQLTAFPDGGFSLLRGAFPYSQGVIAAAGFVIERARFARPVPDAEGFRRIAAHLESPGRPKIALCACELRSPKPFSFAGFGDFNRGHVAVLAQWEPIRGDLNPVARGDVSNEGLSAVSLARVLGAQRAACPATSAPRRECPWACR